MRPRMTQWTGNGLAILGRTFKAVSQHEPCSTRMLTN